MTETEFEKAFRAEFKPLSNVAFSILRDEDSAKDIVQQVFLKLWDNKDNLSINTSLQAYLRRSVVNTTLNHIAKQKKITLESDLTKFNETEREQAPSVDNNTRLALKINQSLEKLPPKCRTVFSLSRYSGLTNKEIAEDLDISIKAVEKHIGKALKELRVLLKPVYKNLYSILFLILEVGFLNLTLSLFLVCSM